MKLEVDKDVCIGCGACQAICPEVFEIDDDGLAKVISDNVPKDKIEDATDAKEGCPVSAISDVESDTNNIENDDNNAE